MADSIVDLTDGMGGSMVSRYLERHPSLQAALADAGARVVVFEWGRGAGSFFEKAARALADAETRAHPGGPALFVALTNVPEIVATGAFALRRHTAPIVRLECRRGVFLGYIAIGEGGVVFFDADGEMGEPGPATVLAAIEHASHILHGEP